MLSKSFLRRSSSYSLSSRPSCSSFLVSLADPFYGLLPCETNFGVSILIEQHHLQFEEIFLYGLRKRIRVVQRSRSSVNMHLQRSKETLSSEATLFPACVAHVTSARESPAVRQRARPCCRARGRIIIVTWCHRDLSPGESSLKPDELVRSLRSLSLRSSNSFAWHVPQEEKLGCRP